MLQSLHVKNLALIDEAEVNFEKGLNILSGETGAGKSIIIGSVNLALGAKASAELIRKDAPYGLVELTFQVDHPMQQKKLEELDIFLEDQQVLMSRKIMSGRSVCRINGETVSAAVMRSVASLLIDIHGQHEHQSLLSAKNHLKYLDAYGQDVLAAEKEKLAGAYRIYQEKKAALKEADLDKEQQTRELSFLEFEVREMEEAQLTVGEDEVLESEYRKLSNSRKIMEAAGTAYTLTGDGRENSSDMIGHALRELLSVCSYDAKIETLTGQLQEIDALLGDFNRDLSGYLSDMESSDERFFQIQERLDIINHLKAKYGDDIAKILRKKEEKEARIQTLQNYDVYRKQIEEEFEAARASMETYSDKVSQIRKEYAVHMEAEMVEALQALNFLDVKFEIRFEQAEHFGPEGTDVVRFFISTNPGEELRPLDQVASGGELSRIMLGLKTILAENDEIETLIFDEIDAGISGRTAQMVAEKMKVTAKDHQIICITHLPQIAAMADVHFLIEKVAENGTTVSNIRSLSREESIEELARMLGGARITSTVLDSAREMKEMAESVQTA